MKIRRAAVVLFTCSILFWSTSARAADDHAESSILRDNKEKLIKTKSCPGCNLAGANLNRADLAGADLQGADLSQAKFFLTNLSGANLRKANLQKAGFGGADLANADLREADLRGASLGGAYLRGAQFDKDFAASLQAKELNVAEAEAVPDAVVSPEADGEKITAKVGQTPVPPPPEEEIKDAVVPAPPPPAVETVVEQPPATQTGQAAAAETHAVDAPSPDPGIAQKGVVQEQPVSPPAAEAVAVQEAPPVKTVQPMGEPVISEATAAENGKPVQEAADEEGADKPVAALDPGGVQTPAAGKEDAATREKLDQLVKSKSCYACNLVGLDLSGKNLQGADLEKADLSGCNLQGADLDGANLKGAFLVRANLQKASLKGADLYKADLTGADLTGANMQKVLVDEANFSDTIGLSEEILKQKK